MLKYLYTKEVFSEVPGEISLGISLSGCNIHCPGCHSRELWEDKGTSLTIEELDRLIEKNKGITCVLLLGGESNIEELTTLFKHIYTKIKTAWYCGLDLVPKDKREIIQYLNYLKVGHYDSDLGGLISPETNQRFYKIEHLNNKDYVKTDLTNKFQKQKNED